MNRLCRCAFAAAVALLIAVTPALALDTIVTVTGEASTAMSPDIAAIHAGVTTQAKTAREATEANSRQMTAVMAVLKAHGIAERDIKTSRLSIQPVRDNNRGGAGTVTGFVASNQVAITLRDLARISDVIDRIIAAGANDISGIGFSVTDPSKLLDRVRADAVEDARRKAAIYAKAAGGKLGRALAISDQSRGPMPLALGIAQRSVAVPIAPGEDILHVAVTVTFELQP